MLRVLQKPKKHQKTNKNYLFLPKEKYVVLRQGPVLYGFCWFLFVFERPFAVGGKDSV